MQDARACKAKEYFLRGYSCSQSVLLAFKDEVGLEEDKILKLASSFGGGIGGQREVCGALSGMLMAAGLLYGYSGPKDYKSKAEHYALVKELSRRFRESNGSIICRVLLGLEEGQMPAPQRRTAQYHKKRPCAEFVFEAAKIMSDYIAERAARAEHADASADASADAVFAASADTADTAKGKSGAGK